jgi:hypothetical protein
MVDQHAIKSLDCFTFLFVLEIDMVKSSSSWSPLLVQHEKIRGKN